MRINPKAALGFATTADDYEATRPSYPPEAIEFLTTALGLRPGRTVVDVAAGTGKLTRLLVPSGARVVAVEPVAEMRALLERAAPMVTALDGTAEDLPLADRSADAITVAQAFHWFDRDVALPEFRRVLTDDGALAVVYNRRQPMVDWVVAIDAIIEPHRGEAPRHPREFADGDLFALAEEAAFDNPHTLTPEETIARFRSLSFVGAMEPELQADVLDRIRVLLATHPATAGKTELTIPQRTVVSILRKA
jgi:SAM-dependent methyltransferase